MVRFLTICFVLFFAFVSPVNAGLLNDFGKNNIKVVCYSGELLVINSQFNHYEEYGDINGVYLYRWENNKLHKWYVTLPCIFYDKGE